jgi:hypothetical protein
MNVKESLDHFFFQLLEPRQNELLDFARFLSWREEQKVWRSFGREQFAQAYGPDDPEYTTDDLYFTNRIHETGHGRFSNPP